MWKPIADPETARRCWDVIAEIEQGLLEDTSGPNPSLSGGSAGVAVFFAYLDAARQGSGDGEAGSAGDHALETLGSSIDALGETVLPPSLYSGFSGIGWTVEHLTRRFYESEDDLCSALDEGLHELLSIPGLRLNTELIAGLSGFGVYLVERLSNPAASPAASALLGRIVDHLDENAEDSEEGLAWHTLPEWMPPQQREMMPGGCYNLGVAHGIPGVLGFLAAARREGFDDPRLDRLAEGLVRWLLGRKLHHDAGVFASHFVPDRPSEPSRLAWCYGDPGIAAVLLSAARSFGRPDWEAEALDLIRRAAGRPEATAQAVDAALCHGTAGLAHLFNRIHQATGDPGLREAALELYLRTLDKRRPGKGIAGYQSYLPGEKSDDGGWTTQPGLLIGAAGIGLALLAAVSDVEPDWDRVLLTAVPSRHLEDEPR